MTDHAANTLPLSHSTHRISSPPHNGPRGRRADGHGQLLVACKRARRTNGRASTPSLAPRLPRQRRTLGAVAAHSRARPQQLRRGVAVSNTAWQLSCEPKRAHKRLRQRTWSWEWRANASYIGLGRGGRSQCMTSGKAEPSIGSSGPQGRSWHALVHHHRKPWGRGI